MATPTFLRHAPPPAEGYSHGTGRLNVRPVTCSHRPAFGMEPAVTGGGVEGESMRVTVYGVVYKVKGALLVLRQAARFAWAYMVGGDGQVARELANVLAAASFRQPSGNAAKAAAPVRKH